MDNVLKKLFLGPGYFQTRPSYCCVTCALWHYKIPQHLVEIILTECESVTLFDDVLRDEKHESFRANFSSLQLRAFGSVVDSLIDTKPVKDRFMVHPRYNQEEDILVRSPVSGLFIENSVIPRGSILEIFFTEGDSTQRINQILDDFESQVVDTITKPNRYSNLPYLPVMRCVKLKLKLQELHISWSTSDTIYTLIYDFSGPISKDYRQLLESMRQTLRLYERISMVIFDAVDNTLSDFPDEIPTINKWLEFLATVFPDFTELIIIFGIKMPDFNKYGAQTYSQVREIVNDEVGEQHRERIKCLESDVLYNRVSSVGRQSLFS